MKIIGVICEYNPFHAGHQKQLDRIRADMGADCGIVCLMSGNFVQRGHPAVFHRSYRAAAALACGADLVLELPVTVSLSSAEGFAARSVAILSPFCHALCFGAETSDVAALQSLARALLSPTFSPILREELARGLSFPAARQAALTRLGLDGQLLTQPNNILAVEYCKAILSQRSSMVPYSILRDGDYHAVIPDAQNPSATALRNLMQSDENWRAYLPAAARPFLSNAPQHTLLAGERAVLARLRSMDDSAFAALPYGSEGLWRKLMHAARQATTLEDILSAVKSKRYTRTRLDRMVLCAFLGLTASDLAAPPPYTRVLGLNSRGREILKLARTSGVFPNIGEKMDAPFQQLERRCSDLYGLFAVDAPEPPGQADRDRIIVR